MTDLERANQRAASAEKEAAMLQERWVVEERKHLSFCEFRLQELNKQEIGEQVNLEAEGEGLALRGQLAAKEAEVALGDDELEHAAKACRQAVSILRAIGSVLSIWPPLPRGMERKAVPSERTLKLTH